MSISRRQRSLTALLVMVVVGALSALATPPASSQTRLVASGHAVVGSAAHPARVQLVTVRLQAGVLTVLARHQAPGVRLPASTSRAAVRSAAAAADRDDRVVGVELLDAAGRVTYRRSLTVDRWIRSEVAADPRLGAASAIDSHRIRADKVVTNIALPAAGDYTSLRIEDPVAASTSRTVSFHPRRLAAPGAARRDGPTLVNIPGYTLGNADNRIDILIMGDGYTAAQESQFESDAADVANGVLSIDPYKAYRGMINIAGVFAASNQSGADHPPYQASGCASSSTHPITCCPDSASNGLPSSYADTRYDSSFCAFGIERLIVPLDQGQVMADAAAAYPGYDQIIVVSNDPEYGGAGGAIASTSKNASGVAVMQHELGHSLMGLDDEYTDFTPGFPACSDMAGSSSPCKPNVTDVSTRADLKWNRWVDASTAIPTSSPQDSSVVGDFLGAHYSPTTYYRPCDSCIMRFLNRPFGAVEAEQLPVRLYTGSVGGPGSPATGLSLIEPGTAVPGAGSTGPLAAGAKRTFKVDLLSPGSHGAYVVWSVDGHGKASGHVPAGARSFTFTSPDGKAHTISLKVVDDSGILHPSLEALSASTTTWTVSAGAPPPTGQLVRNGGFEKALAGTWKTSAGAARDCARNLGHASRCAVRIRASASKGQTVTQAVPGKGVAGERVVLSAYLDPVDLRAGTGAVAVLKLANGKVLRVRLGGVPRDKQDSSGYLLRKASATLPASLVSASVKISLGKGSGLVLVDDVSLKLLAK